MSHISLEAGVSQPPAPVRFDSEGMVPVKPRIDGMEFGWIRIDGEKYEHDVVIRLDGKVKKRKKKLSKAVYGTSHKVSLDEAKHVFEKGAAAIIVGSGQHGVLELSEECSGYFEKKGIAVEILPTPKAVALWNKKAEAVIGSRSRAQRAAPWAPRSSTWRTWARGGFCCGLR